jgi:predicted permease
MEAEFRAHIDARVEYLVARGHDPQTARAEAMRRFGDVDATLEILQSSAEDRERRLNLADRIGALKQDVRFVLRGLGRSPVFTAGVIATLTLGLGINSAVFRIADRVLLRAPVGVVDPSGVRRVSASTPVTGAPPVETPTFTFPAARLVADSRAFARASTYASTRGLKSQDGRDISGIYVDSSFFALLGVKPAAGRFFDARETEPGAEIPVVVVSHDYWQRDLGGVAITSGLTTKIGDRQYQVVGVTPRGFVGLELDPVDVWLPFGVAQLGRAVINGVTIPWYRTNNFRAMRVIGRMPSGAMDSRVAAQAGAGLAALDVEGGSQPRGVILRSLNASRDATGSDTTSRLLGRLAGVAIVVLLISCANAANLLLARAMRRRREIAVRLALGGARSRIVRLLVVESLVLGLGGGLAAALAGYWTGEGLRRLLFPDGRWATTAFDDRTMVFTLVIALAAGLVAGLAPALQLTNPDLVTSLKDNRHQPGRRSHHTRAMLVVLQTAFSMALLIGSGLLVRSMQKLNAVNIGFEPEGLVTTEIPNLSRFAVLNSGPVGANRMTASEIFNRLRNHPDVRGIALASLAPFGSEQAMDISVPGQPAPLVPPQGGAVYLSVSANYFTVMGTRLVRGRLFNDRDVRGSLPVALVSEALAKIYWPDREPFGTCILLGNATCAQVVGVVETIRDTRGGSAPRPRFYLPLSQQTRSTAFDAPGSDSAQAAIIRTAPARAVTVAATIKSLVPAGQRVAIEVTADRVNRALRPWRLGAMLFSGLGIVALLLACVGVYSVMSYIASERIHELGVRIVLGATSSDIVRLVLASGARLVLVGAALGLIGAALGARLLASLLFGVSPLDPGVYIASVVVLAVTGTVATMVPAIRAMRTDPTEALRAE